MGVREGEPMSDLNETERLQALLAKALRQQSSETKPDCPDVKTLWLFECGELSKVSRDEVAAHLADCAYCVRSVGRMHRGRNYSEELRAAKGTAVPHRTRQGRELRSRTRALAISFAILLIGVGVGTRYLDLRPKNTQIQPIQIAFAPTATEQSFLDGVSGSTGAMLRGSSTDTPSIILTPNEMIVASSAPILKAQGHLLTGTVRFRLQQVRLKSSGSVQPIGKAWTKQVVVKSSSAATSPATPLERGGVYLLEVSGDDLSKNGTALFMVATDATLRGAASLPDDLSSHARYYYAHGLYQEAGKANDQWLESHPHDVEGLRLRKDIRAKMAAYE